MKETSLILFNLVVEIGAVQGVIMALVLNFSPKKNNGKNLFGLIISVLALLSFKILIHTLGLWNLTAFHFLPLAIDTTLPPLIYLYICSITGHEVTGEKIALYFIPTIVFMFYALVVYVWALTMTEIVQKDLLSNKLWFNQIKEIEDFVAVISAIIYWLVGLNRINRYRQWLFDTQSDSRLQELTWLKNLLIISAIMVLALAVVVFTEDVFTGGPHQFIYLQLFYIYLAVITYYLSIKGYSMYSISRFSNVDYTRRLTLPITNTYTQQDFFQQPVTTELKDYQVIKQAIIKSFEEKKVYLNPELDIKQLARHLGYPSALVSAAINRGFKMNFRNLVNQYRVNEFKARLINPPSHLSLFGIALDCGFNSEASFYRVFRQETGLSPNDYIQKHKS